MDQPPIHVVLCDDYPVILAGIKAALEGSGKFLVLGVFSNPKECISYINTNQVDLLVCDINLGAYGDAFKLMKECGLPSEQTMTAFLTAQKEENIVRKAKNKGVNALISKELELHQISEHLSSLKKGEFFSTVPRLSCSKQSSHLLFRLTKREMEILQLIFKGHTSAQIADIIFTSRFTVETHRRNIYKKTGATNLAELLKMANESNLMD